MSQAGNYFLHAALPEGGDGDGCGRGESGWGRDRWLDEGDAYG